MPETTTAKRDDSKETRRVHKHKEGVRTEIIGKDDAGIRRTTTVPTPAPKYVFNCPACIAEDKDRLTAPPQVIGDELQHTVFLVPEDDYDRRVCAAYLAERYPAHTLNVTHQVNLQALCHVKGAQIVVINRRRFDGKPVGPREKRKMDDENKWTDFPVEPSEYIRTEIVEAEVVRVAEEIEEEPASVFMSEKPLDLSKLADRLTQLCLPRFKLQPPVDPADKLYVMRSNS